MNGLPGEIGLSGVKFFGTMTAAVSHDIKNVMAIINENAGLIRDLVLMSRKGGGLDVERIDSLAERCGKQVARANDIIRELNRFSHSVDDPVKQVDLMEILQMTLSLSSRFARLKGVSIALNPGAQAVSVTTSPFFLCHLLWRCMEFVLDVADEQKEIRIDVRKREADTDICLSGLGRVSDESMDKFSGGPVRDLLNYLKADLKMNLESRVICIVLPINPAIADER